MRRPIKLALIWALLLSVVAPILGTMLGAWINSEPVIDVCLFPSEVFTVIYIRILSHFRPIGPLEFDTFPTLVGLPATFVIYSVAFFFFFRWRARRVANAFN
jgi:hypothetical protein